MSGSTHGYGCLLGTCRPAGQHPKRGCLLTEPVSTFSPQPRVAPTGPGCHQVPQWLAGGDGGVFSTWPQANDGGDPGCGLPTMGRRAGAELKGPVPGPCGETGTCVLPLGHHHPWAAWAELLGATWNREKRCMSLLDLVPPSGDLQVAVRTTGSQVPTQMVFSWQGVEVDARGHVVVDKFQNTSRKGVYAVGDVCGRALLTPGACWCPPSPCSPARPGLRLPVPLHSGHRGREEAGAPALWGPVGCPSGLQQHPHCCLQPPTNRDRGPHRR